MRYITEYMKQATIRIEAFVTVEMHDEWDGENVDEIPINIDVPEAADGKYSKMNCHIETEITTKEVSSLLEYGN